MLARAITPSSCHGFHACTRPKLQGSSFCGGQRRASGFSYRHQSTSPRRTNSASSWPASIQSHFCTRSATHSRNSARWLSVHPRNSELVRQSMSICLLPVLLPLGKTAKFDPHIASEAEPRWWRTRIDPFEQSWTKIERWLEREPCVTAKELTQRLTRTMPELYPNTSQLRTLQRRVSDWRRERAKQLVLANAIPSGAIHEDAAATAEH
jgi:hypothetical protein